jgi:hypothetical protein
LQRISIKELRRLCNRQIQLYDLVKSLTDHRKKYEIPLSHIFYALFYTTILSINNLLSKDKLLRKKHMKRFIGSKREMVASDSTLERALSNNLDTIELKQINLMIKEKVSDQHFMESKLNKKCAIIDGTFLGGFMKEVLLIPGKTDYILNFNTIPKKGKELVSYAAHLRWRIENNGFKELNNLYETKRKYSKNEKCFTNLLWIIVLSYNIFHLYLGHIDLSSLMLIGKSIFKDWINDLFESLIEDYSINTG